jgi:hypothetical protein
MTDTIPTALDIAGDAQAWFATYADAQDPRDWGDEYSRLRFLSVLRSGDARAVADRSVAVSVADHQPNNCWGYVASYALDHAGQNLPDTAVINQVSATVAIISW